MLVNSKLIRNIQEESRLAVGAGLAKRGGRSRRANYELYTRRKVSTEQKSLLQARALHWACARRRKGVSRLRIPRGQYVRTISQKVGKAGMAGAVTRYEAQG